MNRLMTGIVAALLIANAIVVATSMLLYFVFNMSIHINEIYSYTSLNIEPTQNGTHV